MMVMVFTFFLTFAQHLRAPQSQGSPQGFFIFPVIWLAGIGGWITNLTLGIVYAIESNRGGLAGYPIFGKWLLRRFAREAQNSVQS